VLVNECASLDDGGVITVDTQQTHRHVAHHRA
jgi:hypothetical protein